jgi:hypothetical protein
MVNRRPTQLSLLAVLWSEHNQATKSGYVNLKRPSLAGPPGGV